VTMSLLRVRAASTATMMVTSAAPVHVLANALAMCHRMPASLRRHEELRVERVWSVRRSHWTRQLTACRADDWPVST
jgi:hypothetical protein